MPKHLLCEVTGMLQSPPYSSESGGGGTGAPRQAWEPALEGSQQEVILSPRENPILVLVWVPGSCESGLNTISLITQFMDSL